MGSKVKRERKERRGDLIGASFGIKGGIGKWIRSELGASQQTGRRGSEGMRVSGRCTLSSRCLYVVSTAVY